MATSTKISPARLAAFEVLQRVEQEDAFASNLLSSSRHDGLSREDRALLNELVLGVLRWQGQLDYLIELYSKRPLSKLDIEVTIALRLGLYQMRQLTRIPAHAAINESVNLVKLFKKTSAAPMVNAVLRAAQRGIDSNPLESIGDPVLRLSIEVSHPTWLIERWISRFGIDEARQLALAANSPSTVSFRAGRSSERAREWFTANGIRARSSLVAPGAEVIETGSLSPDSLPVSEGWIYLQDEASQLVAHLAAERSARLALDLCAAPGSKTTLLASLLGDQAMVAGCDIHHHRLISMRQIARKLGQQRIELIRLDASRELPFPRPGIFDTVLLDAPCSGLGTLQRHPEIKWRAAPGKIEELSRLQKKLIANAASQVRPGGLLTYAVCSTEPEEGEDVIKWFRESHSGYRDMTRERLIEVGSDPDGLRTGSFGARTFPHRHGTEGFFFCVLWKRQGAK